MNFSNTVQKVDLLSSQLSLLQNYIGLKYGEFTFFDFE
jgi:hypothetical protein